MSQFEKLIKKLLRKPQMTFEELERIILNKKVGCELLRIKGSHHIYRKGDRMIELVKHGGDVDGAYISNVIDLLEDLGLIK